MRCCVVDSMPSKVHHDWSSMQPSASCCSQSVAVLSSGMSRWLLWTTGYTVHRMYTRYVCRSLSAEMSSWHLRGTLTYCRRRSVIVPSLYFNFCLFSCYQCWHFWQRQNAWDGQLIKTGKLKYMHAQTHHFSCHFPDVPRLAGVSIFLSTCYERAPLLAQVFVTPSWQCQSNETK